MGAVDLLCDLMAEGVEFEADGNRVRWRNGGTQLTQERLAVLKDGKAEVLQFLNSNSEHEYSVRNENPDTDAFEERAAICEYDGGLTRADAERLAAQGQGYDNVVAFRAAQMKSTKGSEND